MKMENINKELEDDATMYFHFKWQVIFYNTK